jgi:hypothetical protein
MNITLEIPNARIMQLFWSAIEGGDPVTTAQRGGWCNSINLTASSFALGSTLPQPEKATSWYALPEFFADGVILNIEVIEVDDETTGHETTHKVTNADFARGLSVMATEFPSIFGQIMEDQIDAPCADIFLQCMLFGEEKYA